MRVINLKRKQTPSAIEFLPDGRIIGAFRRSRPMFSNRAGGAMYVGGVEIVDCESGERIVTVPQYVLDHMPLSKAMHYSNVLPPSVLYDFYRPDHPGKELLRLVVNHYNTMVSLPGNETNPRSSVPPTHPFFVPVLFQVKGFGFHIAYQQSDKVHHYTGMFDWNDIQVPLRPDEVAAGTALRNIQAMATNRVSYPLNEIYSPWFRPSFLFDTDPNVHLVVCGDCAFVAGNGNVYGAKAEVRGKPIAIGNAGSQVLVLAVDQKKKEKHARHVWYVDSMTGGINKIIALPHQAKVIAVDPTQLVYAVAGNDIITLWDID